MYSASVWSASAVSSACVGTPSCSALLSGLVTGQQPLGVLLGETLELGQQRVGRVSLGVAHRPNDLGREGLDRRMGEQAVQRQVDGEIGANMGDDLRGQQRMPAEAEEVVLDTNLGYSQDPRPDT